MQIRDIDGHEILEGILEFEEFVSEIEVKVMSGAGIEVVGSKRLRIFLEKRLRVSQSNPNVFYLIPDTPDRSGALGSFPKHFETVETKSPEPQSEDERDKFEPESSDSESSKFFQILKTG